jgi:tetratricopeptide (TPR) repeat protein
MFRRLVRLFLAPLEMIRRRPGAALALLLLLITVILSGLHCWALQEFHEAEKALNDDRLDDAAKHLSFCLTAWPWSADTHFLAARIGRMSADYPEAEAQLEQCRRLQGATARTQLEMLLLRAQRGDDVDNIGEGLLLAAENGEADKREVLEALARGYMTNMRYLPARAMLDRCIASYPNDVNALDWRGWVLERLEQQEQAAQDYQRVLELSPERHEVRMRLAMLYLDHNDPVQAEPHLLKLQKVDPNRPEMLLGLARCRFAQGDLDAARVLLDRVLAVNPQQPTALVYRGKLELQANPPRLAEAESYFQRALKNAPNDPDAHNALYDSLRGQPGREAEADAELKKYNELVVIAKRIQALQNREVEQASQRAEPAYELGRLNLELGNDDIAMHWLKTAEQRDATSKPTHFLLAELYEKKGDKEEAARQRALAGEH